MVQTNAPDADATPMGPRAALIFLAMLLLASCSGEPIRQEAALREAPSIEAGVASALVSVSRTTGGRIENANVVELGDDPLTAAGTLIKFTDFECEDGTDLAIADMVAGMELTYRWKSDAIKQSIPQQIEVTDVVVQCE